METKQVNCCYIYLPNVERIIAYKRGIKALEEFETSLQLNKFRIVNEKLYITKDMEEAVVNLLAIFGIKVTVVGWCKYCESLETNITYDE